MILNFVSENIINIWNDGEINRDRIKEMFFFLFNEYFGVVFMGRINLILFILLYFKILRDIVFIKIDKIC